MSQCKYQYPQDAKSKCLHPIWPTDSKYCIFHSEHPNKKEEFDRYFLSELGSNKFRRGEVHDFRGFVFPPGTEIKRTNFDKRVWFDNARFQGNFYISDNCNFLGPIRFVDLEFLQPDTGRSIILDGCVFNQGLSFKALKKPKFEMGSLSICNCNITGRLEILKITFNGDFSITERWGSNTEGHISKVTFNGNVALCDECFSGGVSLEDIRFGKSSMVIFGDRAFSNRTYFSGIEFPENLNLGEKVFSGNVTFAFIQFNSLVEASKFDCSNPISLTLVTFSKGFSFLNARLDNSMDFVGCEFYDICNFAGVTIESPDKLQFTSNCYFHTPSYFSNIHTSRENQLSFERASFGRVPKFVEIS